ncbi:S41 family peptidase [Burkholderia stabilis]|uniref:C-terminal processing peptidase,Peptidase family S41 n=1 Tax=Burkholderia stabilis TaxID=95485 RepID=A0AAJ5T5X4_9BURK|nr:S41 family peptidase [Burkholderia stabilis]VBB13889.1 C-terminal processing peptidase,Peptidase family S41 [Burkholderia stabilis]
MRLFTTLIWSLGISGWLPGCGGDGNEPVAPGGLPPAPPEMLRAALQDGAFVPQTHGIWALAGTGVVAEIGPHGAVIYNTTRTGNLCWRDPAYNASTAAVAGLIGMYAHWRGSLIFTDSPDGMQLHARPLAVLPVACRMTGTGAPSPLATYDAVAALLLDFHTFAAEYGVDWPARIAKLRPQAAEARNDAALAPVLDTLLGPPVDAHTSIGDENDTFTFGWRYENAPQQTFRRLRRAWMKDARDTPFPAWLGAWQARQTQARIGLLRPDARGVEFDGSLLWGVLDGNIGYLAIDRMGGFAGGPIVSIEQDRARLAAKLDTALARLKDTQALVLDLSLNQGGAAQISHDIAARFADRKRLAYTRALPQAAGIAPQPFHVEPGGAVRYAKPVVVLTSDVTVSAGEYLVLMMRTLPHVAQAGQTTQGALSGGFGKGLPNGWMMGIANHVTRDPAGVSYEARGIRPDVAFDVFPDDVPESGLARAVTRAAQLAAQRAL